MKARVPEKGPKTLATTVQRISLRKLQRQFKSLNLVLGFCCDLYVQIVIIESKIKIC